MPTMEHARSCTAVLAEFRGLDLVYRKGLRIEHTTPAGPERTASETKPSSTSSRTLAA